MKKRQWFKATILSLILAVSGVSGADAKTFDSAEFLTWKRENRDFYLQNSIGMAGVIASLNDEAHAKCIDDWYFQKRNARHEFIYDLMKQYPSYHPHGIIAGVLEKQCGSFNFRQK